MHVRVCWPARSAPFAAAALAVLTLGCSQPADVPPSIVLITIDTLRPDYLGLGGYDRPTSPELDALIGRGFYFEQAVSPVGRTTPALASLLTGAYPHTTGVRRLTDRLRGAVTPLAEDLQAAGYQTIAVVTNHLLVRGRGLDRGFDSYDVLHDARGAIDTTALTLLRLTTADLRKPLFLWVHYIDPHVPYHPLAERAREFDPGYEGPYVDAFGNQPRVPSDGPFRPYPEELPKRQAVHQNPLDAATNAHIRRLYAADIRAVDDQLRRLLAMVRNTLGRDPIVIITSDHGESLGEHDFFWDHGEYVYGAGTRVPLAIVLPEDHALHGSGRCQGWVSLVDVVPTVYELLDRPLPTAFAEQNEGRSLVPCFEGQPLPPAPVFAESGHSFSPDLVERRVRNDVPGRLRAVVLGDHKLIWAPFQPDGDAWQLFDLAADPDETVDLYRPDHPAVPALRAELERWLARADADSRPAPVSPEDQERLRALGYVE